MYAQYVYRFCNCIKKHCIYSIDILSWYLFMMNTNWGCFHMTENSMFSITKIIFCIVLYSVSEPFISDYIEPDWTRTTLYVYPVVSICMDTFLQLDSLYFHFSVLIQLINFQLVDRQKHYYSILERGILFVQHNK